MSTSTAYSLLLLLAAAISGVLAVVIWRRARNISSGPPLVVLMLGLMEWSGAYAIHWSSAPRPDPYFWLDSTFLGVVTVPAAAIAFALTFTNRVARISPRLVALLAVEPLITLLFLWTDTGNGLFFGGYRALDANRINLGGPVFWVNVAYSYLLLLGFSVLLAQEFFRVAGLYRRQVGYFLVGVLLAWLINILGLIGLGADPQLDLTSISFTITGIFLAYGLFRYQLLDVLPIARDVLIERMSDGVMVIDARSRIVDANPALGRLFGVDQTKIIGLLPSVALAGWSDIILRYAGVEEAADEILLPGAPERYYDVRIAPLRDRTAKLTGRLIVVRDVTAQKQAEIAAQEANTRLQEQVAEITSLQEQLREQAIRDPLTGLFNRRYFEETLDRELAQARRNRQPLSLVLLDLDLFKQINDTFGHAAGDLVLQELGRQLTADTRVGDVVSRLGGEEFVIMLLGATATQAEQRAESWRVKFEQHRVPYEGNELGTTFSAGVAAFPEHGASGSELLRAADAALYLAKHAGRNRVTICSPPEVKATSAADAASAGMSS